VTWDPGFGDVGVETDPVLEMWNLAAQSKEMWEWLGVTLKKCGIKRDVAKRDVG
jgi:hypothetical protein